MISGCVGVAVLFLICNDYIFCRFVVRAREEPIILALGQQHHKARSTSRHTVRSSACVCRWASACQHGPRKNHHDVLYI